MNVKAHHSLDELLTLYKTQTNPQLARRIQLFMSLPIESLDKLTLKEKLAEIGRIQD